jgi:hypothetical protein
MGPVPSNTPALRSVASHTDRYSCLWDQSELMICVCLLIRSAVGLLKYFNLVFVLMRLDSHRQSFPLDAMLLWR